VGNAFHIRLNSSWLAERLEAARPLIIAQVSFMKKPEDRIPICGSIACSASRYDWSLYGESKGFQLKQWIFFGGVGQWLRLTCVYHLPVWIYQDQVPHRSSVRIL
jgi:hypothetical protein